MKKKKERRPKLKFSRSIFSTVGRISATLGVYIEIAKGFFVYKNFASLGCVYLGTVPMHVWGCSPLVGSFMQL